MPDYLDPFVTLRQIARSLIQTRDELSTSYDLDARLDEAALMIDYIANALEREFHLAAERGRKESSSTCDCNEHWPCTCIRTRQLADPGSSGQALDTWNW